MNWGSITINHNVNVPNVPIDLVAKFVELFVSLAQAFALICASIAVCVLILGLANFAILLAIAAFAVAIFTRSYQQPEEAALAPAPAPAPEVVAQKLKEAEITEFDENHLLLITRDLPSIAIYHISNIRKLFPENYFYDKPVPALEMKIKWLMPMDAESKRMIDWMERGVCDALKKKYLKTLLFCVCETVVGPMIEEYAFSFSYSNSESQEVSMNVNRIGNQRQGGPFKCNSSTEISPNQMRSSACKMVHKLTMLTETLDKMPKERTILMKLLYYDVTPVEYEPPFFRRCTEEEEGNNPWTKNPLKMEVGNVNSKHLVLALKVKSVLDRCKDEDNDNSLEAGSVEGDASDSKTEELDEPQSKLNQSEAQTLGSKQRDFSTCGVGLRSILDLTRMIGKSDAYQNGSIRSDHTVVKMKEPGTPTSRAQTADSRESFTQVMENGRTNGNGDNCGEFDAAMCSKSSSQSKRSRKASTVKESILQYTKRQIAQVA